MEDERLRRVVSALKLPQHLREDVVQAVWVKVTKGLHVFQAAGAADKFHAWMSKVAHNEAVSLMRRLARQRVQSLEDLSPKSLGVALDKPVDPEELREVLDAILAENPTNYWLVVGRYLEGRPVKALADEAGLTPAAVSCRIHRSILLLRAHFGGERQRGQ